MVSFLCCSDQNLYFFINLQERIQLETARLYKVAGINPLAGIYITSEFSISMFVVFLCVFRENFDCQFILQTVILLIPIGWTKLHIRYILNLTMPFMLSPLSPLPVRLVYRNLLIFHLSLIFVTHAIWGWIYWFFILCLCQDACLHLPQYQSGLGYTELFQMWQMR